MPTKKELRELYILSYNFIVPQNNKKYNSLFKIFIRKRDEKKYGLEKSNYNR